MNFCCIQVKVESNVVITYISNLIHVVNSNSQRGAAQKMVSEGRARLFRRKDGKYLIYVPLDLAEDSMFPFKTRSSLELKISFRIGDNKLVLEKWVEPEEE